MPSRGKAVLVVDDDPDARAYLSTVLEDHGYEVRFACDGVEALSRIETEVPALITLDIAMPAKSGVAVYRALKEDPRHRSIPVIMVTGVADEFKRFISTRSIVPPPEGYLTKPVDADEFLRLVVALIGPGEPGDTVPRDACGGPA
ncbi:MAG: response regulator [Candidatus Riflebacteria bacterium]|nr:response regulator [Candidatus Riflebacteria bacterium]